MALFDPVTPTGKNAGHDRQRDRHGTRPPLPRRPGTGVHPARRRRQPREPGEATAAGGSSSYCYPAALTPGCTTQAVDFTEAAGDLAQAGLDIIGISPDDPEKLLRFREKEDLGITLVSDPDKAVLQAYGAYGPKKLYGKEVVGVIRSTFIVDAEGRIEKASYNVKATGHVAKLRRELGLD